MSGVRRAQSAAQDIPLHDQQLASQIHNRSYADQVGYIRAAKERLHTEQPDFDSEVLLVGSAFEAMLKADATNASAQATKLGATEQVQMLTENINNTKHMPLMKSSTSLSLVSMKTTRCASKMHCTS
jgi:hypothetical protein